MALGKGMCHCAMPSWKICDFVPFLYLRSSLPLLLPPSLDLMKLFAMSSMYFTVRCVVVLEQFITMINVVTLGKLLI